MYSGTTQVNVPWTLAGVTTVYGGAIANFNQPVSGPGGLLALAAMVALRRRKRRAT